MKVLVVGNGGREHAIAWKLGQSQGAEVLITKGNGGTDAVARALPVSPTDIDAVVAAAQSEHVGLVAVGPEAPLAAGLADRLIAAGIPVFGVSAAAARLESSKAFAHEILEAAGVPAARWHVFDHADDALRETLRTIRFSVAFSMSMNLLSLTLSTFGIIGPAVGAMMHELSALPVLAYSARLVSYQYRPRS